MATLEDTRNTRHAHPLDASFVDEQRRRLIELQQTLRATAQNATDEHIEVNAASAGAAREYEEDAQNLTMLETQEELVVRTEERLARIERALAKITEGTYGFSDLSGEPIPRERLVTVPEAVCTLEEEHASEKS